MAIAYRASGTFADANSTTTGSIGLPAGLANGDTLVLVCQSRGTGATVTTPSGYTLAKNIQITNSHRLHVFYKYVTNAAGEVAPAVVQSVSGAIRARLSAFSGCSSTSPLDTAAVASKSRDAATVVAPTITPVSANAMAVWIFSTGDDNTLNASSQGTNAYSSDGTAGADGSIALTYELQGTTAAATGTCSMTESANGPDNWCTITLALRPTVAAPANPSRTLGFDSITYALEMALGDSPFTSEPTWVDLSAYVRAEQGITVTRGRNTMFSDMQPGTMSFTLDNRTRLFDPDYSAGTYFGKLVPQVRCRLRLRKSSTNYPIFDGYIQGWPQGYVYPREAVVQINCVDLFSRLATRNLPAANLLDIECLVDGAVGHWPLDEDPGGFSGIAFDNSGNGVDGSWNGASVETFLPGEPGRKAKYFTYSDTYFQHFGASHSGGLDLTGMRTLEFWMIVNEFTPASESAAAAFVPAHGDIGGIPVVLPPSIDPQIVIRAQSEVGFFYVNLHVNQTFLGDTLVNQFSTMDVTLYDSTSTAMATQPCPIFIGLPMHVVCILDDGASTLSVYLNGVQVGSSLSVSAGTFFGGSLEDSVSVAGVGYVTASFCHVAVYNVELTATQVGQHYVAGTTGGRGQTPADRLEVLADFAGLVDAAQFDDSDLADHTYLARSAFLGNVLTAMQDIVRTEQGRMFVDAAGVVQVQGRSADIKDLTVNATSQATLADSGSLAYTDLTVDANELELLRNTIYLSTNGGNVVVYDNESRTLFDERSESITVLLDDATAAKNLGLWRTLQFSDPATRITSVTLKPHGASDTRYTTCFTVDLGWRVTIQRTPQGIGSAISKVCTVEGIQHRVTERGPWETTLYLAPAVDNYTTHNWWVLGDSTYGKLDGTHCVLPY